MVVTSIFHSRESQGVFSPNLAGDFFADSPDVGDGIREEGFAARVATQLSEFGLISVVIALIEHPNRKENASGFLRVRHDVTEVRGTGVIGTFCDDQQYTSGVQRSLKLLLREH